MGHWVQLRGLEARTRCLTSPSLPCHFLSTLLLLFLSLSSSAGPTSSSSPPSFSYLPLLLLPGRVQQQVPVPVVLLLHVGLRPPGRRLVIGSVIIYHVSGRNLSAPQRECHQNKKEKTGGKKGNRRPKVREVVRGGIHGHGGFSPAGLVSRVQQ